MTPSPIPFPPPAPEFIEGELAIGDSLHAGDPGTGLTVKFLAVTGDSRCPKDVVCVWAGQADVLLLISGGGMPDTEVTVTLDPGTPETIHVADSLYAVKLLRLLPDPPPVGGVDQPDYRLSLRITQQPQGESAK